MHDAAIIILARGGSKGLRNKNLLPLAGKPCVAHTIDAALEAAASHPAAVCLSSDSPEILAVGTRSNILTHQRGEETAGDTATVDAAARQAVRYLIDQRQLIDHDDACIVILYGNVPIRPAGLISQAMTLLRQSRCDSVQSYTAVGKHHPYWTVRVEPDGQIKPWQGDVLYHNIFRRQDLPPAQVPDGGVLVVSLAALFYRKLAPLSAGAQRGPHDFLGTDRRGVITPLGSVIDIDDEVDYELAQVLLRKRQHPQVSEQRA